jgi:hypothetical protein
MSNSYGKINNEKCIIDRQSEKLLLACLPKEIKSVTLGNYPSFNPSADILPLPDQEWVQFQINANPESKLLNS